MRWGRKKSGPAEPEEPTAAGDDATEAPVEEDPQVVAERAAAVAAEAEAERVRTADVAREARRRQRGPFDSTELDEEDAARPRVDLGSLKVPAVQGMELRLEMEDTTQRVIGAVLVVGPSTLQLQAFAAPRTEGIWHEVRGEIRAQVARQGGGAEEVEGAFGPELLARMPVRTEDGRTGHRAVRFLGVDGPRWFVRAVFGGRAAVDGQAYAQMEALLRALVVERGGDAMAPRDVLPLQVPPQDQARPASAVPQAGAAGGAGDGAPAGGATGDVPADGGAAAGTGGAAAGTGRPDDRSDDGLGPLDPFHRGPEITEIR